MRHHHGPADLHRDDRRQAHRSNSRPSLRTTSRTHRPPAFARSWRLSAPCRVVRRRQLVTTHTRTFVLSSTPGADFTPGPIQQTGNPLDVAIQGPGWLAVQTADGTEAYTRAGNLHVDANGQLVTANEPAGARRRRPDHRAAGRDSHHRQRRHHLGARRRAIRRPRSRSVDQLKLVNPDRDNADARRRRPVPHRRRQPGRRRSDRDGARRRARRQQREPGRRRDGQHDRASRASSRCR